VRRITLRYEAPTQAEKDIATWSETMTMIVVRLTVRHVAKVY